MSLFKKIIFGTFVTLALGCGAWAYLNLKNNKKPKVDALSVLPDNCLVYLRTPDFFELNKKINSQSLIADRLKLFKDINVLCNSVRLFDSLFNSRPLIRDEIAHNPIHFAVYPDNLNWLAAFNVKQLGQQYKTGDEIARLLHAQASADHTYEFSLNRRGRFYFSVEAGVVLLSNDPALMSSALNRSQKKLYNNAAFGSFKNTLEENSLLSVYINHDLYLKSKAAARLNLPGICTSGASAGVIDLQPSQLKINGFFDPGSNNLVSVLKKQSPQAADFESALPLTAIYFQAYGLSSFSEFKAAVDQVFPDSSASFWKTVNDTALYNLKEDFYNNAGNHLVDFENETPAQGFVMLAITDTLLAAEQLKLMSDSVISKNGSLILRLRKSNGKKPLKLFSPLSPCVTQYAALYRSHIYFSASESELAVLVYQLRAGISMSGNESFMAYKRQNFPETYNYLVYDSPALRKTARGNFFNFETSAKKDPFENFRHFSFSLTQQGGRFEYRWHLVNITETINKEQNILWTLQLDTTCSARAWGFLNHVSGENEMLLQDDNRQLYLVNAKGTVLWKKMLPEKITSEIFTVDLFKNHKYQALFSTKNYLHLIDRNGNYVQGYPVKLPAEATNALSVFDYDNTRDYRLFIACKNKQVYNYALLTGKRQEGFVPYRTEHEVKLPVQYVKVGLSDYLVALDEEGKIYTFSRRGDGRIGLKNRAIVNCQAFYIDATGNIGSTNLVYVDDKNSLIHKISFTDKKEIVKVNYNIENAGINFCRAEKSEHVIFTKINALLVYDLNGNLLFNRSFENDLEQTDFYADESQSLYLTRSSMRKEMILVDPLKQQTRLYKASAAPLIINLFNDNKKYLVVANGSHLSCMLLNF